MTDTWAVRDCLGALLRELFEGPPGREAFVLNPGDRGLLASLESLTAAQASERLAGRSSVAAHVDHLRYGFELLNRWARGENPWTDANYATSWGRHEVNDDQWSELRAALDVEAIAWRTTVAERRTWDEVTLTGALASAVHLAYHLGAIRQLQPSTAGPPASD